ncbi:DNA polymerase III subunit beta [Streptacidiphilus rugosus]|uniref:DNA polymerase III subunit beta n=1 Tax=Streptacidiphilus rugosus TaxID=405783 RepID=UPI00056B11A0|nr:DNA polymerase III subunit beta [Streptacidiphilus rugosus]
MKLRLAREALAEAVAWAAHALPARSTAPALSGLLLTAAQHDGGTLTVSGFDYEVSARFQARAEVLEPGAALVPGRLLADLARVLPSGGHEVELSSIGSDVALVCGPVQFELPVIPLEDYPRLPSVPAPRGTVDGALFAEAVAQVAVVAGRDESLPVLTGIRMEFHAEILRLVATDRYRLAVRELPWTPAATSASVSGEEPVVALVPARSLHEIARSLTKGERIAISPAPEEPGSNVLGGLIGFAAGSREATTRLLGADFIRYQSIFPSSYTGSALIERAPLLDAVKRMALVTERHQPLRLSFSPGLVVVNAGGSSEARGRQALDARFDAEQEPIMLAANAGYLVDGLSAIGARFVELRYTTPTKPAVLTGREDTEQPDDSYRYLFMPQRAG